MKQKIPWLCLMLLVGILLFSAAATPDREVAQALKDQNEQLKRIAISLEIIAGQRGSWKVPRN